MLLPTWFTVVQVQDAFNITKKELFTMTSSYQDTMRDLKLCTERLDKEMATSSQLREEIAELHQRIEVEYGEKTELELKMGGLQDTVSSLEATIKQLEKTSAWTTDHLQRDQRITSLLNSVSQASTQWIHSAEKMIVDVKALKASAQER